MKVTQYFTGHGMLGIIFFFVGNVGSAWLLYVAVAGPAYERPSAMTLIGLFIFGMAAMASFPMMLIGRAYDIVITGTPKVTIAADTSK